MAPTGTIRTLIADAHMPTASKSTSRSSTATCFESFERCERPDARAAERLVEEHAGDDEWPGERAASRLVGARDEAHAELAIESEETLAAGSSHAAESTS